MKRDNKGLTLVELLCVIIMVGIFSMFIIVALSNYIMSSEDKKITKHEQIILSACRNYLKKYEKDIPQTVGEYSDVSVKQLLRTGYLKDKVTNSNRESCIDDSFVRIYKYDKNDYSYMTYLYCDNDNIPEVKKIFTPSIIAYFTDGSKKSTDDDAIFRKNENLKLQVNLNGGVNETTDSEIFLYNYFYTINLVDDDIKEIYKSGVKNAYKKKNISFEVSLSDYVDLDKLDKVQVVINSKNVAGGVKQLIISSDALEFYK